ncbi:CocE/NonD family hydrolase [Paeniglutamicibacter sulfureus]|nr:CocE/NonD family hydrolase [Paeniglutamicibacter sulfureus]MDO2934380.1 CocE/NonD family hydrolase [Paeniglutamicibacter sulfureus]
MSDGCRLATDVYLGDAPEAPRPVLLERTPYGKRSSRDSDQSIHDQPIPLPSEIADFFVRRGYVVIRQDCRGRGNSEGEFVKYLNEGQDGVDTIAWIEAQPWCDGRVLMNGVSYSAHVQTAAAALAPSGLAAMFMDSGGFSSAYEVGMRMGGAFELKQATWAFRHAVRSPAAAGDPVLASGLAALNVADWFHQTPWRQGSSPLSLAPDYEGYLLEQWAHENFDDYWAQPAIYARDSYDKFPDVPSFHISSWYDPYIASAIENFQQLGDRKSSPAYLLLGPWTHGKRCQSYAGDVDFGPAAYFDGNLAPSYLDFRADWMDEVLGRDTSAVQRAAVTYFLMGGGRGNATAHGRLDHGGRWEHAATWPPENAQRVTLYCSPDGGLIPEPVEQETSITYAFDPNDPVPTIGGQVTSGEPVMRGGAYNQVPSDEIFGASQPHLPLSARPDVLVFRTQPLQEQVGIAGEVTAEIFLSSSAKDTDLTIKLIDEYPPSHDFPQGFAMNLTEGILRVRYRNSFTKPELMEPHRVYRVTVSAPATANLFAAGHRIRLDVSSSNFPRFDVNSNTGGTIATDRIKIVAENTVHMSDAHPTSLSLDVLPD